MPSAALEKFRSQSKLFSLLDEKGQQRLLDVAGNESHPVGKAIVKQGDEGDAFYVVSEGTLQVDVDGKVVAKLEHGAFFGEIAALLGESRSATVTSATPVTLIRFEMPKVKGIIQDYPAVRQVLTKLALKRSEDNLAGQMKDFSEG
jgi:CRP-like cAMP-binding protein